MRVYILLSVLLGLAAASPKKGNSNNNNNAAATTTTAAPTTTTAATVVDGDVRILEYLTQSETIPGLKVFLQLAAEKKTPFLVQLEFFWLFLFCDGFNEEM